MVVVAGFDQGAEMAHSFGRPKLAGAFEPSLSLAARGFDRPRANGPTALVQFLIVEPTGMGGEIILFALDHLARLAGRHRQARQLGQEGLFLAMPQLVAAGLDPLGGGGGVPAM
jgi:hypothetical protein